MPQRGGVVEHADDVHGWWGAGREREGERERERERETRSRRSEKERPGGKVNFIEYRLRWGKVITNGIKLELITIIIILGRNKKIIPMRGGIFGDFLLDGTNIGGQIVETEPGRDTGEVLGFQTDDITGIMG